MSVRVRPPTRAERLEQAIWWVDHPVAPAGLLLDAGILTEDPGKEKLCLSEVLEALWARADHGTGRRRSLSIRTLLVGLHLARSWEGTSFLHDGFAELGRLEPEDRRALGVGSRLSLTKRRFDYLWGEVIATFDPEPAPSRRLGKAFSTYEAKVTAAALAKDEAGKLARWRRIVAAAACLAGVPEGPVTGRGAGNAHGPLALLAAGHDRLGRPLRPGTAGRHGPTRLSHAARNPAEVDRPRLRRARGPVRQCPRRSARTEEALPRPARAASAGPPPPAASK